jgi:hypothetical protein
VNTSGFWMRMSVPKSSFQRNTNSKPFGVRAHASRSQASPRYQRARHRVVAVRAGQPCLPAVRRTLDESTSGLRWLHRA